MTKIYNILIEIGLIFLIIFTPLAYGSVHPWSIAIFEITAGLMALFLIFKMLANGRFEFTRTPINGFIFLFIFYVFLQLWTMDYGLSTIYPWATKTDLLKVISYALIFFITLNTIKTKRQITRILSIIITTGFIMSIFFLIRYFGAKAPRGIINSDHFAGYLGMVIPLALGFLFVRPITANRKPQTEQRILLFFCVVVMGAALFFTMSRGGMFSFIAALLFMAALVLTRKSIKKKGWILSAVVIFLVLTIAWLGATPVIEKILSTKVEITSRYFGGRLPIWQGTLNIIKNYPIFGTGLGTFNYIFPKYQPAQIMARRYTYAHSDILQLLSETGIIGFSLFALCAMLYALCVFRRFRARHDPWVVGISIGIFGALASIFLHSFADFNLHIPANAILLTLALALFVSILNYKHENRTLQTANRITKYIFCPLAVLLMCIFITASIRPALADYYFQKADLTKTANRKPNTENRKLNIELLERAIKLDPTNAKYHYSLGKLYSKLEACSLQPEACSLQLAAYKKAVELSPSNSKYHQSLAWTYGQLADLSKCTPHTANRSTELAHKHFQQAIHLAPNNSYRHRAYAIWLFNHPTKENVEKGIAEYIKVIELEPKLAEEAFNRYYKLTKDYSSLKKIIPHTADGYLLLAGYLNKNGLMKKSIQLKKQAVSMLTTGLDSAGLKEKVQIHMKLASVYRSLGESDKAINEYQKAIKINSGNFWAYYWTGVIYKEQGNYEMAIKVLKKASEIDPQNSWSYFELARIYEKKGNISQAKAMWQTILNLKTPSSDAKRIAERELRKL